MKKKEVVLQGIPASPGISIGRAYLLDSEEFVVSRRKITPKEVENEITRFNR